jgi:hypothetical protein
VFRAPLSALPAELLTIATYLAALESSHSPSTIRRRLAAIGVSHQLTGMETSTADISLSESYQLTPAQAGGSGEDHLRPKPTWHQEASRQTVQNRGYSEQVQALVFIAGWMTDEGESIQQLLEAEAFADSLVPAALRSRAVQNPDGSEMVDLYLDRELFPETFAADVNPETAAVMAAIQRSSSGAAAATPSACGGGGPSRRGTC